MALIRTWKSLADSLAEEQKHQTLVTNKLTLEERALQALEINRAFLMLSSPTNAQLASQLKALTRQNIGIIRLLLNKLEDLN